MARKLNLIWNAEGIGDFLGIDHRRALYLCQTDQIPGVVKRCGRWVSSEEALLELVPGAKIIEVEERDEEAA